MYTILISGDRNWSDFTKIRTVLTQTIGTRPLEEIVIVHGDAKGADKIGGWIAKDMGIPVDNIFAYPADWNKHGKAAGPIRNEHMLKMHEVDIVLAFHSNIEDSKGTKHMISCAMKKRIPYILTV